jgi:hypothetical protein
VVTGKYALVFDPYRANSKLRFLFCRAIAQAVNCRLPTASARVRSQSRLCGICGEQSGTGAGFILVLYFPWEFSFHQMLHTHLSSGPGTTGILVAGAPSGLMSVSPHEFKEKTKIWIRVIDLLNRNDYFHSIWRNNSHLYTTQNSCQHIWYLTFIYRTPCRFTSFRSVSRTDNLLPIFNSELSLSLCRV